MAKEKKEKCEKCGKKHAEGSKCPQPKGSYGLAYLGKDDDEQNSGTEENAGVGAEGGLGEAIKMPRAPQDSDRSMKGASKEKKQKKMDEFKKAADEAKKRQSDKKRSDELYMERRKKGIRFYDAKGSGYMKGGKKHYD